MEKLHIRRQMTVYRLWANSQLTVFGELFFTFSTLASAVKRMHVLVASYEFLVHVIFSGIHFQFDLPFASMCM